MSWNSRSTGRVRCVTMETLIWTDAMDNPQKFTEYAEFCERLAKTATTDDKKVLLDISKAWRLLAEQAERKGAGIQSIESWAPAGKDGGGL